MQQHLTCPQGHFWEFSGTLDKDNMACPVCGAACAPATLIVPGLLQSDDTTLRESSRAQPARPLSVPGYEILGELGEGAMGRVFKARHLRLGRLVALKILAGGSSARASELARFQMEAEVLAALQHPNIVGVFDVGEYDGLPYLAMELVEGGTLADRLKEEQPQALVAAAFMEKLARAVHAAHQCGIIHRDLKPSNILLARPEGKATTLAEVVPKISDFGLARRLEQHLPGETGAILGTPLYMAPEQASGQSSAAVGTLADVYALGVLLFELLTGRPPFLGKSTLETLELVRSATPVFPRGKKRIQRDLEIICLKCLNKEPQRRYSSALALAEDLHRFLAHEPIGAKRAGVMERLGKWVRRRPAEAGLVGVSVVAAAALLGLGAWSYTELRKSWRQAEMRSRTARRAVDDMYTQVAEKWLDEEPGLDPVKREFLEKALALYEELAREESADPEILREQGLAYYRVGRICDELGDHERAELSYTSAWKVQKQLREEPGTAEDRQNLATTLNWLGECYRGQGQKQDQATEAYREALQLQEGLAKEFPQETMYWKEMARSHYNLGIVQADGSNKEAEQSYGQAIDILGRLRQREPNQPDHQQELARSYLNRAKLLGQLAGRMADAEADGGMAISLLGALFKKYPYRPRYRFELAVARTNLGNQLLGQAGRLADARKQYELGNDLLIRLTEEFPHKPRYLYERANCQNSLGGALVSLPGLEMEAEQIWRRSLRTFDELVKAYPGVADYHYGLGRGYLNLGWLALLREKTVDACSLLQSGRGELQECCKKSPGNVQYQSARRDLLQNLAEAGVQLGDHELAFSAVTELLQAGKPDAEYLYLAACFAARCRVVLTRDCRSRETVREATEQRYAQAGVKWLGDALSLGFAGMAEMANDRRLDGLRDLPEFHQIVKRNKVAK